MATQLFAGAIEGKGLMPGRPDDDGSWDALGHASDLQRLLLAQRCPDCDCMDVAVLYEPAHRVGGDFYDILPVGEHERFILIGDVVGHQVPSGLVMALILGFVWGAVSDSTGPSDLLHSLNAFLIAHGDRVATTDLLTTLFVGALDVRRLTMRYSIAGHPPPLVQMPRNRRSKTLSEGGIMLGVDRAATWCDTEVSFEHGDRLLLYTDGFTDALMPSGERCGIERLMAILDEKIDAGASRVIEHTRSVLCKPEAADDCTLVVLTFNGR